MTLYKHPLVAAGSVEPANGETARMFQMITGYWVTQVVRSAAELHLADHLHAGRSTAEEIAGAESLDPAATLRFLRACVSLDLATSTDGTRFTATPLLDTLRSDSPDSLRDLALWGGMISHWAPWGELSEAVRTGASRAEPTLGMPGFDYFAANPREGDRFTAAMTAMTRDLAEPLAEAIDVGDAQLAVDVGGAAGNLVQTLMRHHPSLRGAVLDLPHASAPAEASATRHGVAERFTFVGGDFFESVPAADIHLLKFVLHDWDDASGARLLRNCRDALNPGGRIMVAELLVDEVRVSSLPALMDLNMLTVAAGRERTQAEFEELFHRAGLRLERVAPSNSVLSVLEAVPA